jgi:hypothetical protein
MKDRPEIAQIKDEINLALDHIEGAGLALAEVTPAGKESFTERLGRIMADLEQFKADVWDVLA